MAPTIKWQRWDSASYDWFGATSADALPGLEAELDAWITAVNGNASNSGRTVTKERGYADSTGGNYAGLVISCGANSDTAKGYLQYAVLNSTSTKKIYAGDTFVDDTSNGGYGAVSGGPSDTSVSWYTSGQSADWLICYDTTDGEEFFIFGPSLGASQSANYMDGFMIMKATDGEWLLNSNDGSNNVAIHYYDDDGGTGWSTPNGSSSAKSTVNARSQNTLYWRFGLYSATTPDTSFVGSRVVYAANPNLLNTYTGKTDTGTRTIITDLGNGNNVYILSLYYYGPTLLVDLRP